MPSNLNGVGKQSYPNESPTRNNTSRQDPLSNEEKRQPTLTALVLPFHQVRTVHVRTVCTYEATNEKISLNSTDIRERLPIMSWNFSMARD